MNTRNKSKQGCVSITCYTSIYLIQLQNTNSFNSFNQYKSNTDKLIQIIYTNNLY